MKAAYLEEQAQGITDKVKNMSKPISMIEAYRGMDI
jgi:hypothetical protein